MPFLEFFTIYLIAFAVLVLIGGIQGLMKGSKASIIAAGILGALALIAAYLLKNQPGNRTLALILALLSFLGVAGKFFPAFLKAPNKAAALWPAGLLGTLAVAGLALTIYAFVK
jgi:uncharacterized membrane protein (UPF0136 family)